MTTPTRARRAALADLDRLTDGLLPAAAALAKRLDDLAEAVLKTPARTTRPGRDGTDTSPAVGASTTAPTPAVRGQASGVEPPVTAPGAT